MPDNDAETIRALDALDLLEAAFTGNTDRFVALLPTDLDLVETLLVDVVEQAQRMVEYSAPVTADASTSAEELRVWWLSWVLNTQRLAVCGSDAVAEALREVDV